MLTHTHMHQYTEMQPEGRGRSSTESLLPEDKGMYPKPVITYTHTQLKIQKSLSIHYTTLSQAMGSNFV